VHKPDVLILDEPFGALDAFTREDLWQTMHDVRAKEPFTAVLITHDLRESVFLADQVVVLSGRPGDARSTCWMCPIRPGRAARRSLHARRRSKLNTLRHQIEIAQGRAHPRREARMTCINWRRSWCR
jgi:NitT/TauT family transport system ATP-binding protein